MISVIIPTYKNNEQLLNNLSLNLKYLNDCEIIVVNDDPTNNLKQSLNKFKQIKLIENSKNLGFAKSINIGLKQAKGEYIMLLNNDVLLINNNYQSAINYFQKNEKLFAVSFAQVEKDKNIVGKNILYWKKGFMLHKKSDNQEFGDNAWAEGGSCLIDKSKFLKLNGFDEIYSPFYWEDVDLSYRAKNQGYNIIFDSSIKVIHHHESTIGKFFTKNYIAEIAYRNQLIFIWKNIKDKKLIFEHFIYLLPTTIHGGIPFIKGLFQALIRLPKIIIKK